MLRLNYVAPADHTGYACAAAQYLRLLAEADVEVHFQPLGAGEGLGLWYEPVDLPEGDQTLAAPLRAASLTPLFADAPTILHIMPEYYAPLSKWLRQRGVRGPILGMTVWETSRLPRHWPALLNVLHGVIVPSEWNAGLFRSSGVTVPVYCLPHVSEFHGAPPEPEHVERLRRRLPDLTGKFVFYSIGAWNVRKGNDLLLRAFLKAFEGRNDVVLVLKTSARSLDPSPPRWQRVLRRMTRSIDPVEAARSMDPSRVLLLTDDLPAGEIAALHALGDCYVTCSRGEGWGLGLYEAVLLDKPAVAPDQGGHRAYIPSDQSMGLYRSRRSSVRTASFDASYTSDQWWVEPDVDAAAQTMQTIESARSQALQQARKLGDQARRSFSRESISVRALTILSQASTDPARMHPTE